MMAYTLWHDGATVWRDSRLSEDSLRLTVMVICVSVKGWFARLTEMVLRLTEDGFASH